MTSLTEFMRHDEKQGLKLFLPSFGCKWVVSCLMTLVHCHCLLLVAYIFQYSMA